MRTKRESGDSAFIKINDGSCLANIQMIADSNFPSYDCIKAIGTGAVVSVSGELVASPGKGQKWEIRADSLGLIGAAPEDYPLQTKRHSDEFLRTIAHLRPRTSKYGAIARIRTRLAYTIHQFFNECGSTGCVRL